MGVNNSDFEYMAHRRGDTQKDMFYIGAYLGYVADNKLRSLSGKTPADGSNTNINQFLTLCRTNSPASDGKGGSGYDGFAWYQLIFIQCMYVLKYKNLNNKQTIGLCSRNDNGNTTGETNTKGMDWGDKQTKQNHMKLFGIEDLYSNKWCWIYGAYTSDGHIYTATEKFSSYETNYVDRGTVVSLPWKNTGGTMTKTWGTTHLGFLAQNNSGGSQTTYYIGSVTVTWPSSGRYVSYICGTWNESDCSIFGIDIEYDTIYTRNCLIPRLMYL